MRKQKQARPKRPRLFLFAHHTASCGSLTEISPKALPAIHAFTSSFAYCLTIMRGAFVVKLGPETRPMEGQFEGWVEEVDSGTELRFRSSDELLKFLGARFDLVLASANKDRAGNKSEQVPPRKKSARKKSGTP